MLQKRWIKLALAFLTVIGLLVGAITVYALPAQHTKTFLFIDSNGKQVPGFPTVDGSSVTLLRTDEGVSINVNTTGLPAGGYSNWWVIFDNPAACGADGCNDGDFGNPAVDAAVFFATGGIVGPDETGHFKADLAQGSLPSTDDHTQWLFGGPLDNPLTAEIHYVIRYHGPFISGKDMTTTFGGGCDEASRGPFLDSGPDGDFFCYDVQAAVIPAP